VKSKGGGLFCACWVVLSVKEKEGKPSKGSKPLEGFSQSQVTEK
jgi:hypothetical protein